MPNESEFFTRETWRPSKKRKMQKRVKPWGGRKTAPAAFLEAARRVGFQKGHANRRICNGLKQDGTACGNLALTGMERCGWHGGFMKLARQGKLQPTGRSAAYRAERAAAVEGRAPVAPLALTQIRIYQQADQWSRARLARAWDTESWPRVVKRVQARITELCV